MVAYERGEYARAAALLAESLRLVSDLGARDLLAHLLEGLAWVGMALGQPGRAARLGGAAKAVRGALHMPLVDADRGEHERVVATMRAALGEEGFAAAWAEGHTLSLEEAVTLALEGHEEASVLG
jgi:non-specific serine/threonine protein kinase